MNMTDEDALNSVLQILQRPGTHLSGAEASTFVAVLQRIAELAAKAKAAGGSLERAGEPSKDTAT